MTRDRAERGAVLIHVSVMLLGLLALSALVLDFGLMWVSRGQVQNSADAGALAGATALAFDNDGQPAAKVKARTVALVNHVWNQAPDVRPTDVVIEPCPPTPGYGPDTCIRVDAYRNQARANALPTFFATLVGVTAQGVKGTATARAIAANTTNCLKPWVVGDKWFETQPGGWTQSSTYVPATGDYYTPPTSTNPGTGFTAYQVDASGNPVLDAAGNRIPAYYGYQMVLKLANPGNGANQIPVNSAGWAMEICLDNGPSNPCSTPAYDANITGCTSEDVTISPPGSTCTVVDPTVGCLKVKTGSSGANNSRSVGNFIAAHDPTAVWQDGPGGWQTGSIVTTQSPSSRIVPIALIDIPQYLAGGYTGSNGIVRVVNIVGFFLEGTCQTVGLRESYLSCPAGGNAQSAVVGRLVSYPALKGSGGGSVAGSWGQQIILVR